jgi:tRNA-dihydrouridine synthase
MNFWQQLPKPIVALAPMDGVTDLPFRIIQAKYSDPDVIFTEFIPVEAAVRFIPRVMKDLWYTPAERPIVAQVYGNDPKLFYSTTQLICELGFDGIDINMGCPAKSVVHRGCGAALIKTPQLAKDLILTTKQAVADWKKQGIIWEKWPVKIRPSLQKNYEALKVKIEELNDTKLDKQEKKKVPVSVKTRTGYETQVVEQWIPELISTKPATISVHGRTLKQAYKGKADWGDIKRIVEIRDELDKNILILGNGDIDSSESALKRINQTKVDGILVGRGSVGQPYLIGDIRRALVGEGVPASYNLDLSMKQNLSKLFEIMLEHAKLHAKHKSEKEFVQMRGKLVKYIKGFEGASDLRSKIVRINKIDDLSSILENIF